MPNRKSNKTFWEQLTSWPKRSSSKSREQAASRYCDSKAWSWGRQARTTIWQKQKIRKWKWSNGRQEQLTSESAREPPLQVCSLASHTKASSILEARAPLHKARNSLPLKRWSFFYYFFFMSSWMMRRSFFLLFRRQQIEFGSFRPRLSKHDGKRLHDQSAQAAQSGRGTRMENIMTVTW